MDFGTIRPETLSGRISGQRYSDVVSDKKPTPKLVVSTVSAIFEDKSIVELVYDISRRRTSLAHFTAGRWTLNDAIQTDQACLVPFSPHNNLIANEVVLLPERPQIYGSQDELIASVRNFIRKYVDLSSDFEAAATHYVLLTWLYDAFNEVPYLRFRGDFGSGKTRALLVVGSICYKPFFASGASTVSPVFHTLNAFQGTLILDEADFRFSDEKSEVTKILNNGTVRGMPVLRTMLNKQREFDPRAFQVFGPKVVATRSSFEDKGLESRFLTEEMMPRMLRREIPLNLPDQMKRDAQVLRNKLLLFRFHRRFDVTLNSDLADRALEPRFNQVIVPLLSIIPDEHSRTAVRSLSSMAQADVVAERGLLAEANVLQVLAELMAVEPKKSAISVGSIATELKQRFDGEYDRPITNRWVGSVLRRKLNIRTYKSHGVYVVPREQESRVDALCARYGTQPIRPAA